MRKGKNASGSESIVYAEKLQRTKTKFKSRVEKMNSSLRLDIAEKGIKVSASNKTKGKDTNYANDYDSNS